MRRIAVALFAAAAWGGSAQAGTYINGNELLEKCQTNRMFCLAYVAAISDVMDSYEIHGWTACVPPSVSNGQLADIVIKALQGKPEIRHYAAPGLVAQALELAFPCRK